MPLVPTISVLVLRPVVAFVAARGADPEAFLARIGVDRGTLEDDGARVSVHKLPRMFTWVVEMTGDSDAGLHLAESASFDSFGPIGLVAVASETLGDAFRRVVQSTRYLLGTDAYELRTDGATTSLVAPRPFYAPVDRHAAEFLLGVPHLYSRAVSVRPWTPTSVSFAHPKPASSREHARIFGCPVRFDAPEDALHFPTELAESPSKLRSDGLVATLLATSKELGTDRHDETDVVARARVFVWQRLRSGDVHVESVAKDMGLSTRTLQRELARAKTSHREVLDEVRSAFARHLLARDDLRLVDVAVLLGFADQTAFQKAFVRWTGTSPAKFRKNEK
ncbi:MAG: AraC family transcriptional regulator [Polyangiaceae bacterium]